MFAFLKSLFIINNVFQRRCYLAVSLLAIGTISGIAVIAAIISIIIFLKKNKIKSSTQNSNTNENDTNEIKDNITKETDGKKNKVVIDGDLFELLDSKIDISNVSDSTKLPSGRYKVIHRIANSDGKITKSSEQCEVYVGNLINGKRNGYGKLIYKDGDVYEGEWKDGVRDGKGRYTTKSGRCYDCEWKDDYQNGIGKVIYNEDGEMYEGEWKDGNRNGLGRYTKTDGSVHQGEWRDGRPNGILIIAKEDGNVFKGLYKNGVFQQELSQSSSDKYCDKLKEDIKKIIDQIATNTLTINNNICSNLNTINRLQLGL